MRLLIRAFAGAALSASALVAGAAPPDTARSPDELLAWMDADGDGRVALVEYQRYLSRGFRRLDRNGDGVVDAGEWPAGVTTRGRRSMVDLTSHERALARTFERQDADASGFLDARELAAPPR